MLAGSSPAGSKPKRSHWSKRVARAGDEVAVPRMQQPRQRVPTGCCICGIVPMIETRTDSTASSQYSRPPSVRPGAVGRDSDGRAQGAWTDEKNHCPHTPPRHEASARRGAPRAPRRPSTRTTRSTPTASPPALGSSTPRASWRASARAPCMWHRDNLARLLADGTATMLADATLAASKAQWDALPPERRRAYADRIDLRTDEGMRLALTRSTSRQAWWEAMPGQAFFRRAVTYVRQGNVGMALGNMPGAWTATGFGLWAHLVPDVGLRSSRRRWRR